MNGRTALICSLVSLVCLWPAPRATASDEAADPPKAQQEARVGQEDHAQGIDIRYDEKSQRFILKNSGKRVVWFFAYGPEHPLSTVQRLTSDGWVETASHWCGTGAKNFRLDPGTQVAFNRQLRTERRYIEPFGDPQVKYPDLEALPVRVGLCVYPEEHDYVSAVVVWSEKWDGPMPVSPKK